jgi:hypothetical protein
METKKIAYIPSLFNYWPATTVFYRAGDKLLILVAFGSKDYISKTQNLLENLISLGYISSYNMLCCSRTGGTEKSIDYEQIMTQEIQKNDCSQKILICLEL